MRKNRSFFRQKLPWSACNMQFCGNIMSARKTKTAIVSGLSRQGDLKGPTKSDFGGPRTFTYLQAEEAQASQPVRHHDTRSLLWCIDSRRRWFRHNKKFLKGE